jgi:uncharacterized protein (DUF1778 family)
LQQAASAAVSTLVKVMVDPSTPAAARVRAADCILARANQGLENEDYDLRIAALERLEKPDSRLERIEAILGVADLPRAA